jgi:uncharacterized protein (DUF486 family)
MFPGRGVYWTGSIDPLAVSLVIVLKRWGLSLTCTGERHTLHTVPCNRISMAVLGAAQGPTTQDRG